MRGRCIHYTGLPLLQHEKCCKAGVNYYEAFGPAQAIFRRMPCTVETPSHVKDSGGQYVKVWNPIDRKGEAMVPCDKFCLPTPEELEAEQRAMDDALAKALAGVKVAATWRMKPAPAQDRHEIVECPVCKGKLHLSQSAVNGHCHGKCETDGCVHWME